MFEAIYDIPNISSPKNKEFRVELFSRYSHLSSWDKLDVLCDQLGGGQRSNANYDHETGTQTVWFFFVTYAEALAFADAARAIKPVTVKEISYIGNQDGLHIEARLHPPPRSPKR